MRVDPHWDTEGPGQTEVCDLDGSVLVDQQVLGLEIPGEEGRLRFKMIYTGAIPVEHPSLVTEEETLKKLVSVGLHQLGVHLSVLGDVRVHVLLEVHRQELEYQVELGLLE